MTASATKRNFATTPCYPPTSKQAPGPGPGVWRHCTGARPTDENTDAIVGALKNPALSGANRGAGAAATDSSPQTDPVAPVFAEVQGELASRDRR